MKQYFIGNDIKDFIYICDYYSLPYYIDKNSLTNMLYVTLDITFIMYIGWINKEVAFKTSSPADFVHWIKCKSLLQYLEWYGMLCHK